MVWMASDLKERVAEAIPAEMKDKIATEADVRDLGELREFLHTVGHPVVNGVIREVDGAQITEGWTVAEEVTAVAPVAEAVESLTQVPVAAMASGAVGGNAPIKILLKDADISIGRIIVKKREGAK